MPLRRDLWKKTEIGHKEVHQKVIEWRIYHLLNSEVLLFSYVKQY